MRAIIKVLLVLCFISLSIQIQLSAKKKHHNHLSQTPAPQETASEVEEGSLAEIIGESLQNRYERGEEHRNPRETNTNTYSQFVQMRQA